MRWLEVSVTAPEDQAEAAGAVLLQAVPAGLVERPARRGATTLQVYLPAEGGRRPLGGLRRALRRAAPAARVAVRARDDAAWARGWVDRTRPVIAGRVVVAPSWWRGRLPARRATVRIDPGLAFGSGEHATTRLCLDAVGRYVTEGDAVIDVGTGSGVLAIASARLGARRVVATDTDPVAVRVARANVAANRVARRVRVRAAEGLAGVRLRADLIVANLTAPAIAALAAAAARRLAPRGRLVVSGFGAADAPGVARALRAGGLRVRRIVRRRGWCAMHAARA
ncbi:MAG: 50S ribosomal protein L11 methyltransferase [Armatimonadota bacterium]|nr:50S ribosomal protein L11 methyltransferase [Armatimonadota bacterium]MDR7453518.1 50S ribosomal protein L11 methyltransferase [Armatimonadota bacterium]MDR7457830.1 50S ribosomal protein L11 methyltransferase [Armatimonadota bacterium]